MNYYKHYIGDFQRDTSHLSLTERGAYLALIHHYYATEKPLPNDHGALCRIAGAMSKQERDAVKVAMQFFEPMESGLVHARIEAEIEKAGKRSCTNREIALAREAARKAAREEHEQSTNRATKRATDRSTKPAPYQTPDTINQISSDEEEKNTSAADAPELDYRSMFAELWDSWPVGFGEKGSRKNAEAAFLKLKPSAELFAQMLRALAAQAEDKLTKRAAGQFASPFQHVERWIRNRRWEDEICSVFITNPVQPHVPRGNTLAAMQDRSWAEGIIPREAPCQS